jgi:phospholipid transport system substrate-binding protein
MKSVYWLLAGALFAGTVQAVPHYGPGPAAHMMDRGAMPDPGNPAHALRAGMDKLLGFLGSEDRPSPDQLAGFLNREIAPFFDFEHMAKSAGGRLFEGADVERQAQMVEDIKRSFLTKMAEKLAGYERQQVRFMPPRGGNDGRTAQVSVAVLNPGSYPARLDFRLYRSGGQWKVYDVSANGQSAIVHYRQQMMRQVRERRMQRMRQHTPPMPMQRPPYPYRPGGAPR